MTGHTLLLLLRRLQGLDWGSAYPFPARTLPAVRYSPQNFAVLDLHPDGSYSWAEDGGKNRGGARCSDWWSYGAGGARFEGAVEGADAGDCGLPRAGHEAGFPLAPVLNMSAVPDIDDFNPEGSCCFELAPPFLDACAGGASPDCCAVMAYATRLSSTGPFATCLCQPSFWEVRAAGSLERGMRAGAGAPAGCGAGAGAESAREEHVAVPDRRFCCCPAAGIC